MPFRRSMPIFSSTSFGPGKNLPSADGGLVIGEGRYPDAVARRVTACAAGWCHGGAMARDDGGIWPPHVTCADQLTARESVGRWRATARAVWSPALGSDDCSLPRYRGGEASMGDRETKAECRCAGDAATRCRSVDGTGPIADPARGSATSSHAVQGTYRHCGQKAPGPRSCPPARDRLARLRAWNAASRSLGPW